MPDVGKPLMVGESGGSYYAKPAQLAVFNGGGAFASYAGRNDALGIDVYDNLVHLAKPRLAYFSASETAWFGVEPLPFGYADFSRLPTADEGVFFTAPFVDGKPGIQLEHLPPYVATINPGWDPTLPLYRPLGMFDAERAATAGRPAKWDHRDVAATPKAGPQPTIDRVAFVGDRNGPLGRRLLEWGVPLADGDAPLAIVDGDAPGAHVGTSPATLLILGDRVPAGIDATLTARTATALVADADHPWTASFTPPQLCFAEQSAIDRHILRHGIAGPLVVQWRVPLRASDTDWSQFDDVPEVAKCGAAVLYEHVVKPSGAALVSARVNDRVLVLCSLDYRIATPAADAMWRELLANMGVKLGSAKSSVPAAFDDRGALAAAQVAGRFAPDAPLPADPKWTAVAYVGRDRFLLDRVDPRGPSPFSVYVSYWLKCPRALDELLAGGPDVPRYDTVCYVADAGRTVAQRQGRRPDPLRGGRLSDADRLRRPPTAEGMEPRRRQGVGEVGGGRPATDAGRAGPFG